MKNTRLVFYVTHLSDREFCKTVFHTVLEGTPFVTTRDARFWIDENLNDIYEEFDLQLCFEWVVVEFFDTEENVKEVTELDHFTNGQLVFDDNKKQTNKPKNSKTRELMVPTERKTYPSVWIDTAGTVYNVGFAQHNEFASSWFKERVSAEKFAEMVHSRNYMYEFLEEEGWVRVLGWCDPPVFSLPKKLTVKQKNALKDYCLDNGVDYSKSIGY